jgi:hypothetical protein
VRGEHDSRQTSVAVMALLSRSTTHLSRYRNEILSETRTSSRIRVGRHATLIGQGPVRGRAKVRRPHPYAFALPMPRVRACRSAVVSVISRWPW